VRAARANAKPSTVLAAIGALVALAAGAFAMSGCGASATLDPVARAALLTSRQEGARVSLKMQFDSPLIPGGFAITADGYVDQRHRSAQMNVSLAGIPGASALTGEGGASIEMIMQYPVIYMKMPFLSSKLPEGKSWLKLDIAKAAQAAGINAAQLSSLNQTDPTQFLQYLRASSGNVTATGSETLFGVPTTRYHATLQLSHVLDQLPDAQRAAAKAMLEKLGNAGAIPVDVWVDAQGRLRRMQMSISAAVPAGTAGTAAGTSQSFSGAITVDLTSYGRVPPIVAPPSSQVLDASALAGAGLAGLHSGG
jgi:hypothetical protein